MTPEQFAELVRQLLEELVTVPRRITEAYRDGMAEGIEIGKRIGAEQAGRSMFEHWAMVARNIRAHAGQPTYSERRAAELEWVKPKPGDYTGRLTAEEYFGTSPSSPDTDVSLERRAA